MQSDEEVFRGTMRTAQAIALPRGSRQCRDTDGVAGVAGAGS